MAKVVALENLPEVRLLEDITRETAQRVIEELSAYRGKKVALSIFSDGGDVHASKAIGSYISNPANGLTVEARVYGNAFSGALIICGHCQKSYISAGSFALGHKAFAVGADGRRIADSELEGEVKDTLEAMNADQVDLFSRRTGKRKDTIEKWLDEDRSMTAQEATEFGLFDGIIPQEARLAAFAGINTKTMSDKKMRTVKVSAGDALKAIASGSIELPEDQFTVNDADKVDELTKSIEALTKERDELKSKMEADATAKATAETEKEEAVKAKETAETELKAAREAVGQYQAKLEALKKNPLVAQVMPDGTSVVIPGGSTEDDGYKPTEAEAKASAATDAYKNALKNINTPIA